MSKIIRMARMGDIRCTGGSGDGALRRLRSLRTLASCSCWVSIDIKVLTDLRILKILCILFILAILLQTRRRSRKYGAKVWKTLMSIAPPRQ